MFVEKEYKKLNSRVEEKNVKEHHICIYSYTVEFSLLYIARSAHGKTIKVFFGFFFYFRVFLSNNVYMRYLDLYRSVTQHWCWCIIPFVEWFLVPLYGAGYVTINYLLYTLLKDDMENIHYEWILCVEWLNICLKHEFIKNPRYCCYDVQRRL